MSQNDFQKLTLLLAEKRTAHTTLRSGIALSAFSMTISSFILVMASRIVGTFQQAVFIILGASSIIMLILGIYFIRRGFTRMQFHDKLINQILYTNLEASSLFYHTRARAKHPDHISNQYDAVFHFDKGTTELDITVSNITNYFSALSALTFSAYLVVNGPGIKLLLQDSPHADKLTQLAEQGLQIRLCNNAIEHFNIKPESLLPAGRIVPAGLVKIVDLQRKAYVYIKP
ncbi:DsrE family protein [Halodesulfovibrio spirochaetisodalis]|uniref:DsrE family protein n=1 Tax=Halodesulfovibrio spirochaetisodalis TaxID=1560234 RepID=UPI000A97B537|nr:DsrE family protein [Halodesulfovibrio spirochaetisodalis]